MSKDITWKKRRLSFLKAALYFKQKKLKSLQNVAKCEQKRSTSKVIARNEGSELQQKHLQEIKSIKCEIEKLKFELEDLETELEATAVW